jgi:hypothetical protein
MGYESLALAEKLLLFAYNSPVEGIGFSLFCLIFGSFPVICTHVGAVWVQAIS